MQQEWFNIFSTDGENVFNVHLISHAHTEPAMYIMLLNAESHNLCPFFFYEMECNWNLIDKT